MVFLFLVLIVFPVVAPITSFQPTTLATAVQDSIQKPLFGRTSDQASAELTQNGVVETRVCQFQAEGVFPVDAAAEGVGRLPVRMVLDELPHRFQGQSPGGFDRSSAGGVESSELVVGEDRPQMVP